MTCSDGHILTKAERIAAHIALGATEGAAHFYVAMEDGEITGDLEDLSKPLSKAETTTKENPK